MQQTHEKLPKPHKPQRKFAAYAGSHELGNVHRHAVAFAASAAEAEAAADYFQQMVHPQLDIGRRLDVVIALHEVYGAEVRYKMLPTADVPVEWLQMFEATE